MHGPIDSRRGPFGASGLLERGDELAAIAASLEDAVDGDGALIVVEGPAGIGKTELLGAVRRRASTDGMLVLSARGAELEQELPFGVVGQLLQPHLRSLDAASRARLLSGHAARAGRLLGGAPSDDPFGDDPLPEMLHALHWLCSELASERPLLLVVDDGHWADAASLRWLHYLAGRITGLRAVLLVGLRPDEGGDAAALAHGLGRAVGARRVPLACLSVDGVASVVRGRLGRAIAGDVCRACHAATQGNPFLLSELLGSLEREQGPWTADGVASAHASGVSRSVLARVRRLPPAAEAITRALAVLGDGRSIDLVAELAEVGPGGARRAAAELAAAGILAPEPGLRFVHPLVRASIAADLAPGEAGHVHARAARLLHARGAEPDVVAVHLLAADPAGDPWVVQVLRRAAAQAVATGAAENAVTQLRRALAEPPPADQRAGVLLELGRAAAAQLEPRAEEHLAAALDAAPTTHALAVAALDLGRTLVLRERPAPALAALDRGAAAALESGDRELWLRIEAEALTAANTSLERARIAPERAARLIAEVIGGATLGERLVLAGIAWDRALGVSGTAGDVAALAERALAGGVTLTVETADSPATVSAAAALTMADRMEDAERYLSEAIEDARRRQAVGGLAMASCWRSWAAYRRGDLARAEEDALLSIRLASRSGRGLGSAVSLSVLVECLVARGEADEGRAALNQWLDHETMSETTLYGPLLASRARLHALAGDLAASRADFRACGERHEALGLRNPGAAAWRGGLARIEQFGGRPEEAQRLVGEELAIARAFGAPRGLGIALRTAGGVASGPDERRRMLKEAVAVLGPSEARLEHARALHALGVELTAQGDPEAARPLLREALDGTVRCGATAYVQATRAALVAAGGRPRRLLVSGIGALTPSELRVARLAAEGRSNREIAEAGFLALRTVELHLTRSYRKLGIESRRELAGRLGPVGAGEVSA